ncbi:hypothetical protein O6H91_14G031100 [Diphasiastrum complanatum]|uniref:Uncharacterized protein n=1 Tax=Diphasiastrum complanatum TaxID=34168 RepID=A0ACC2BNT1_DIPCM|nr:hypothetical protein O6H91_14G031100 [Diphasiastrum complanatum]
MSYYSMRLWIVASIMHLCCVWAEQVSGAAAPHENSSAAFVMPVLAPSPLSESSADGILAPVPSPDTPSANPAPLLPSPTPLHIAKGPVAPVWWDSPGNQPNAGILPESPPSPDAPTTDMHSIPHQPYDLTPTPSPNTGVPLSMKDQKPSGGLSGGAKAGISFGIMFGVSLFVAACYVYRTRRENIKRANTFQEGI